MAIIGIDLGTTNSLGCVYKDGRVQFIPVNNRNSIICVIYYKMYRQK